MSDQIKDLEVDISLDISATLAGNDDEDSAEEDGDSEYDYETFEIMADAIGENKILTPEGCSDESANLPAEVEDEPNAFLVDVLHVILDSGQDAEAVLMMTHPSDPLPIECADGRRTDLFLRAPESRAKSAAEELRRRGIATVRIGEVRVGGFVDGGTHMEVALKVPNVEMVA